MAITLETAIFTIRLSILNQFLIIIYQRVTGITITDLLEESGELITIFHENMKSLVGELDGTAVGLVFVIRRNGLFCERAERQRIRRFALEIE